MLSKNDYDFYPTPKQFLDQIQVFEGMRKREVHTILEPSAGKGDLADYAKDYFSEGNTIIHCIEKDEHLRHILKGKDYPVIANDFMKFRSYYHYDLILMNPPFSEGVQHLRKALKLQERYGGGILCILNAETFRNPYSKERKALIRDLKEYNAQITYHKEAFLEAERPTSVEIAVVKVYIKPPDEKINPFDFIHLKKNQNQVEISENEEIHDLVDHDYIKAAVARYNLELEKGLSLIKEFNTLSPYILNDFKENTLNSMVFSLKVGTKDATPNRYIEAIRFKYWKMLFNHQKFTHQMPNKMLQTYQSNVNELVNYDFSVSNIKEIQLQMSKQIINGICDSINQLFEKFTYQHSYYEGSKNIHYFDGWKTNKAYIIKPKVIIPMYQCFSDIWKEFRYSFDVFQKISDIEKCLAFLEYGFSEAPAAFLHSVLEQAEKEQKHRDIHTRYLILDFYKKGTCHIRFKERELLKKLNIYGCQQRGWLPPSYMKKPYKEMNAEEKNVIDSFEGEKSYKEVFENREKYFIEDQSHFIAKII